MSASSDYQQTDMDLEYGREETANARAHVTPSDEQAKAILIEWGRERRELFRSFQPLHIMATSSADEAVVRARNFITDYKVEDTRLKLLRQSVEIGAVRQLRARIANWHAFLSASPREDVRSELLALHTTLVSMSKIEDQSNKVDFDKQPFARIEFLLELLTVAYEIGRPANVAFYIRRIGETLIGPMDAALHNKLAAANEWLHWATKYEEINGSDSLLNRNHPVYIRVQKTPQWPKQDQIL
ncbi:hypothetical protein AB7828_05675 [Tardiphaga sp. 215_C5_N2_1]|uniref:hypothetical protein n=1 Tax=unclassified Tardiphaga TaxID=2631404 RepID=UPI003F225FE3